MYTIKRIDTNEYWQEWGWMSNPWDGQQYSEEEAILGATFFNDLNIPCEIEWLD